jgi:hypothetical protein
MELLPVGVQALDLRPGTRPGRRRLREAMTQQPKTTTLINNIISGHNSSAALSVWDISCRFHVHREGY